MVFEMTLTREELVRLLPSALGPGLVAEGDGFLREEAAGRRLRISLASLPPLALGAITLDRLRVEMAFEGYSGEEREAVLEVFRRATQRGGG